MDQNLHKDGSRRNYTQHIPNNDMMDYCWRAYESLLRGCKGLEQVEKENEGTNSKMLNQPMCMITQ